MHKRRRESIQYLYCKELFTLFERQHCFIVLFEVILSHAECKNYYRNDKDYIQVWCNCKKYNFDLEVFSNIHVIWINIYGWILDITRECFYSVELFPCVLIVSLLIEICVLMIALVFKIMVVLLHTAVLSILEL